MGSATELNSWHPKQHFLRIRTFCTTRESPFGGNWPLAQVLIQILLPAKNALHRVLCPSKFYLHCSAVLATQTAFAPHRASWWRWKEQMSCLLGKLFPVWGLGVYAPGMMEERGKVTSAEEMQRKESPWWGQLMDKGFWWDKWVSQSYGASGLRHLCSELL